MGVGVSRELDEACARALGHKVIEWRVCATDPESGVWEELQDWAAENGQKEGDVIWTRPAERHPCYNWLDTDGPSKNGWTPEMVFDTDRSHYWNVVPFYSSDERAARLLEDYIAGQEQIVRGRYVWKLCAFIGTRQVDLSALEMFMLIRATPEQRARAFLEAIK